MMLTPENKAHIDGLGVYALLKGVRCSPLGDEWFEGETGVYWMTRLREMRTQDERAYVLASKEIGHAS